MASVGVDRDIRTRSYNALASKIILATPSNFAVALVFVKCPTYEVGLFKNEII